MSAAEAPALDLDALPRLEVMVTGNYYTPLDEDGVRQLLTGWARHEPHGYVEDALERMARGEVFTSHPSGFQYRMRGTS